VGNYFDRLLLEYLPTVIKNVREYGVMMAAEQPEIFGLFGDIQTALDNQFILYMDLYGVERWENIIGIVPRGDATLEERRFAVLARVLERTPFTYRTLEKALAGLCGEGNFDIILDTNHYWLRVWVNLPSESLKREATAFLKRYCPANLIINGGTRHIDLMPFTHAQLSTRTHLQLTEEGYHA
jgi:hypothetical protein